MPNQPHATNARSTAGTFAPRTPNDARTKTGKGIPYRVPACAFSSIGISTIKLPSRMVPIACHHAMPPAIKAVQDGQMYATVRNPSCRIHGGAIVAGVQAVVQGAKTGKDIPKNIVTDGPVVTKANADGMLWMQEQFLI